MKPAGWTADGEIMGIIIFVIIPCLVLWASSSLWAYYRAEKARRLVEQVEGRRARARERVAAAERAQSAASSRRRAL